MVRRVRFRLLAVAAAGVAACVIPAVPGSSAPPTPSVGLRGVLHHVDVTRFSDETDLFVSTGMYVTANSGPFEIDVFAAPHTPVQLWQVRRDSSGVHRLRQITPLGRVAIEEGLPRFFQMAVRNGAGHVVARSDQPFCPAGGGLGFGGVARNDPSGPDHPTYPEFCGSSLSQAMIWGIDQGWAVPAAADVPFPSTAPDGDYTLTVTINPFYVSQLRIPSAARSASLVMSITTDDSGGCPPDGPCCVPDPCPPAPAAMSVHRRPATGEGPNPALARAPLTATTPTTPSGVPDLRALPAHDLSIENNSDDGHDYLDFGATIWNAGSGPLVVEGFRNGDAELMTSRQFIYRDGHAVSNQVVGEFEFDTRPGHDHWHMEDIAQYDLLSATGNRVVLSDKQSFCLAPTDPVDLTLPGADWQPDTTALWSACAGEEAIWLREVLPAGWGDTYYQTVAGQSFDITGLANGNYQVRVTTDPSHRLVETDYTNNASLLSITLGGSPGHRTVRVRG